MQYSSLQREVFSNILMKCNKRRKIINYFYLFCFNFLYFVMIKTAKHFPQTQRFKFTLPNVGRLVILNRMCLLIILFFVIVYL